ncbi:secretion protein F [Eubacterium sp. am_0171]|uniref:Flp pilus assembly protein TadB n=1 Tax=Faecalicatena contorta TaxID=39482 RepID=A0A174IBF5_9FIRM|nr:MULTISPECIES: immunoglobulin-like domain-containing protein [Clostridia]MSC83810.1 secretion protein F [Eubacterium sp. BIOML-A1]MSD06370.1 secretion protein F [Eubacterium sp. BIOML-A2]RYT20278.1 secretion protein F [Eubacterium sp. am_0171]CUO82967.1 Flp pilus assembly protein TadB [[Eubacterium] contortum] [Faecalicatena contorta]
MKKRNTVYGRMGLIFLAASAISLLMLAADSRRRPEQNAEGKSVLARGSHGEGSKKVELEARVDGDKAPLIVQVVEQQYQKEELPEIFEKAGERLEKAVLGENKNLDEVRHDLTLVDQVPGMGINVSWESGNYEIVNLLGELQQEHLQEEGTLVELHAVLTYGGEEAVHTFYVNVFPPRLNEKEQKMQKVQKALREAELAAPEEKYLILPGSVDGSKITWKYPGESRAAGLFVLGIVAAAAVFFLDRQKQKQIVEERKKQLSTDYPQLISQFTLFLGAGMSVRKAWFKMVEEYEKRRDRKGLRIAYEEMSYTMHEIQGGVTEGECYERFGSRCGLPAYRRFGALLSQNLRKGGRGMNELLKREAADALEDRKKQARRLGEEAGTKMLGPMFLMLAVVLIIIVVPAFFTIQI